VVEDLPVPSVGCVAKVKHTPVTTGCYILTQA
jgi:hypothetical protein